MGAPRPSGGRDQGPNDSGPAGRLTSAILDFLSGRDLLEIDAVREVLEREIARTGVRAVVTLREHLGLDRGWAYYPPDRLARRIHHALAGRFLRPDSTLYGVEHLAPLAGAPVVIVANHLSYSDANVVEALLALKGASEIADRLTALAGPKIFSSQQRRFSSLCFGTIKVPQSADVSSEEAVLSPREVARASRQAIEAARMRLAAGDALLLFGEGTRSRSGGMRRMLPAAARYFDVPGTWILPAGLTGSEHLFPVGEQVVQPTTAVLRFGTPRLAADMLREARGNRRLLIDALGLTIAELLPPAYRGVYGRPADFPEAARLASPPAGNDSDSA